VAHHFSRVIGVYSLNGCVEQGFLHRLLSVDWGQTVLIPSAAVEKAERLRRRVQTVIWIGSNLPYFGGLLIVAVAALIVRWHSRRRLRIPSDGRLASHSAGE
jgi:hypothetical protein